MSKKILILTASPIRDLEIDDILGRKLKAMGNEVWVAPCLREGRDKVLELQPDIVVVPPIRNMYSRDLVAQMKRWGCKVITRHTEPSCDQADFDAMDAKEKSSVLGQVQYDVDLELVWGPEEADILNKRNAPFKAISVGSFSADKYKDDAAKELCISREALNEKHKLNPKQKTILILSAWGFIDSAPDLHIDSTGMVSKDESGRKIWLDMIKAVHDEFPRNNILVTLHPNVDAKPYKEYLDPLGISLDTELRAMELVRSCDMMIHAGSTTVIGAHFLKKPAFQYGDQNVKEGEWWSRAASPISHVSPHAKTIDELLSLIRKRKLGRSNADKKALEALVKGRYGLMDGKATDRAAELINEFEGQFKYCWPEPTEDYQQITYVRKASSVLTEVMCGICKHKYAIVNDSWLKKLQIHLNLPNEIKAPFGDFCPWCSSRIIRT